jgi:hypothetical protein
MPNLNLIATGDEMIQLGAPTDEATQHHSPHGRSPRRWRQQRLKY